MFPAVSTATGVSAVFTATPVAKSELQTGLPSGVGGPASTLGSPPSLCVAPSPPVVPSLAAASVVVVEPVSGSSPTHWMNADAAAAIASPRNVPHFFMRRSLDDLLRDLFRFLALLERLEDDHGGLFDRAT